MKKVFTGSVVLFAIFCLIVINNLPAQAQVRKVLIEEFTTASCGNCPMMSAYIRDWQEKHAANSILMCIHEGSGNDAMSNSASAAIFKDMHPKWGWFAPAVMIDRGLYPQADTEVYMNCYKSWGSAPAPGKDTIAERLMSEPAKCGIDIIGNYDSEKRVLNATVNVYFSQLLPAGDWRINLFLVEDSVIGYPNLGAFKGWDQHCYDAQWANKNYPGKFDGTSIIGYPHRHVMRASLLGDWGKAGVLPSVPKIGVIYTTTASISVDTAFHDNHLTLVAFVSSYGSSKTERYLINANDIKVTKSFTTSVDDNISRDNSGLKIKNIYPNPASDNISISFIGELQNETISVTNSLGMEIKRFEAKELTGLSELNLSTENLSPGIYFVTLNSGMDKVTRSFTVIR